MKKILFANLFSFHVWKTNISEAIFLTLYTMLRSLFIAMIRENRIHKFHSVIAFRLTLSAKGQDEKKIIQKKTNETS